MRLPGTVIVIVSVACALTPPSAAQRAYSDSGTCLSSSNPVVAPPAGFSPISATDDQLRCYGFPTRPTDPSALQRWTNVMAHAIHYVAPEFGTLPVRFTTGRWSGYHANSSANGNPNWIDVDTENPSVAGERKNDGHYVAYWDGFGGLATGSYLTQVGTSLQDNGSYSGQGTILFFDEWVNLSGTCCQAQTIKNVSVSKGNDVYYDMTYEGSYTEAYFENLTTGVYTPVPFASGDNFSDDSVEWEAEDANAPPWSSYNGESFDNSTVSTPYTYLSGLSRVTDWMGTAGGPYYMKPSGLSGDNFTEIPQT